MFSALECRVRSSAPAERHCTRLWLGSGGRALSRLKGIPRMKRMIMDKVMTAPRIFPLFLSNGIMVFSVTPEMPQ